MTVVSDLVLFNESQFYNWVQLISIMISIFMVILSIAVVIMKDNIKALVDKRLAKRRDTAVTESQEIERIDEEDGPGDEIVPESAYLGIREFTDTVPSVEDTHEESYEELIFTYLKK
jgi:hypothetical protein